MNMTMQLNDLEAQVLTILLSDQHPVLDKLRIQLASLEHVTREFTGVGFYTQLRVPKCDGRRATTQKQLALSGVGAKIVGLEFGAGFLLFITDGYLDMLEGFAYDEPWPKSLGMFSVFRDEPLHRADMTVLDNAQPA